jgi:hypothetical protein
MAYERQIEVYRILGDFNSPLASNPEKIANSPRDSVVVILENKVYVNDIVKDRFQEFAEAAYPPTFVRENPRIFLKLG